MSYEIVKAIKIKDGQVLIKSDSNNVYPKSFKFWNCEPLSKLLQEKGQDALDIAILKDYEDGTFQSRGLNSKYTRALKVLHYVLKDEYEPFNWRTEKDNEKHELRNSDEFDKLLLKALRTQLPKEKFVVRKINTAYNKDNEYAYVRKVTSRHIFYGYIHQKPKLFDFREQAQRIANMIDGEVLEFKRQAIEQEVLK
jgi:hypothetical protein